MWLQDLLQRSEKCTVKVSLANISILHVHRSSKKNLHEIERERLINMDSVTSKYCKEQVGKYSSIKMSAKIIKLQPEFHNNLKVFIKSWIFPYSQRERRCLATLHFTPNIHYTIYQGLNGLYISLYPFMLHSRKYKLQTGDVHSGHKK